MTNVKTMENPIITIGVSDKMFSDAISLKLLAILTKTPRPTSLVFADKNRGMRSFSKSSVLFSTCE